VVDIPGQDDVDAPYGIDLDSDVDMERDGDDEVEEDDEEDDEDKEDDEDEEDDDDEDEDEDDGKEPRMIGQGEMVHSSADDVDAMVEDQLIVLPEEGQEMREHCPQPHPLAPAPRPETLESLPWPQPPQPHPLSGLEILWCVRLQNPGPAVPTLPEAEAAGISWDVDVDQ